MNANFSKTLKFFVLCFDTQNNNVLMKTKQNDMFMFQAQYEFKAIPYIFIEEKTKKLM